MWNLVFSQEKIDKIKGSRCSTLTQKHQTCKKWLGGWTIIATIRNFLGNFSDVSDRFRIINSTENQDFNIANYIGRWGEGAVKVSSRSDITSLSSDHSKVPTSRTYFLPHHDIIWFISGYRLPYLFEPCIPNNHGDYSSDHYLSVVQVSSISDITNPTFDPSPPPKKSQEEIG